MGLMGAIISLELSVSINILYIIRKRLLCIATSLCAQYSLGDDQFEEICKDVDGTLSAFFNASFLIYADK